MPSNLDAHIKRSHIVSFSLLALFSFIEWVICAVLVSNYNSHNDYPSNSIRDRVRFLLFVGLWSFLFAFFYIAGFLTAATSFLFSIASHAVWIGITWVFWLAGAAAITDALGGGLDCANFKMAYCHSLNAVEAFAWINWILITFLLAFVLFAGARSARSGNGFGGPLTPDV